MMISKPCPRLCVSDIVDALEMQFDEPSSFLDSDTGQVETVSHDLLREAEESGEDEDPDLPAWQKQEREIAKRIVSTGRFQKLPVDGNTDPTVRTAAKSYSSALAALMESQREGC
jgi:hypothetical protein